MKKLLGVLIIAATMISSTFALGLSLGGRGLIGGNLDTVKNAVKAKGEGLVYGGGAFVNLELFGGLGVQAETNFVSSQVGGDKNINMVDIPVMAWYNLNLFDVVSIGLGAGVNFGTITNDFIKDVQSINTWKTGLAIGANFKIYFNKHFGIVLGANGVFEFSKRSNEAIADNVVNGQQAKFFDTERQSVYGTLGAEFKLF